MLWEISEGIENQLKNITLKHATKWIFSAWNNVPITVIINFFKHVWIIGPDIEEISTESEESTLIAFANIWKCF